MELAHADAAILDRYFSPPNKPWSRRIKHGDRPNSGVVEIWFVGTLEEDLHDSAIGDLVRATSPYYPGYRAVETSMSAEHNYNAGSRITVYTKYRKDAP